MNCSGAHRFLGPTITRVRSTKLDKWNRDWVENMRVGNTVLNEYWEHGLTDIKRTAYAIIHLENPPSTLHSTISSNSYKTNTLSASMWTKTNLLTLSSDQNYHNGGMFSREKKLNNASLEQLLLPFGLLI